MQIWLNAQGGGRNVLLNTALHDEINLIIVYFWFKKMYLYPR